MKQSNILLLGSIALDTIETSHGRRDDLLGGSATYAAISAGRFVKPNLVGIIGTDFPSAGKTILQNTCGNLDDLIEAEGPTFRWGGKYHENGDDRDTLFTELGVFADFSPSLSNENKNPDFIFLANIHPALQLRVLDQCDNEPVVVTDTMNLWIATSKDDLFKVMKRTDILLINESEVEDLTGMTDPGQSVKEIQSMGPKTVIVKHGSRGSTCYPENESFSIGVVPVETVIDPTGAGDSYGGGLVSGLAEGLTMKDAMIRGTAMASFCIEDFGVTAILNASDEDIASRISLLSS